MNKLSPVEQKFILHWGEMGTRVQGINRTVAQIHALLYRVSPKPLPAEEIRRHAGRGAFQSSATASKELQGLAHA